jgi:hypothetical protein
LNGIAGSENQGEAPSYAAQLRSTNQRIHAPRPNGSPNTRRQQRRLAVTNDGLLNLAIHCEREAQRAREMAERPTFCAFGNWWHHADDRGEFKHQDKHFSRLARAYRNQLMMRTNKGHEDA